MIQKLKRGVVHLTVGILAATGAGAASIAIDIATAPPAEAAVYVLKRVYATGVNDAAYKCVRWMGGSYIKGNGSLGTPYRDVFGRWYWLCAVRI